MKNIKNVKKGKNVPNNTIRSELESLLACIKNRKIEIYQ